MEEDLENAEHQNAIWQKLKDSKFVMKNHQL